VDVITWTIIIAGGGSFVAVTTFWINRGRAEAEALAKAESADAKASSAQARAELLAAQLAGARIEFARD
jgi:hypothetical protein